jgi:Zn-dependent M28 family amino/carboxypeptidase
MFEEEKEVLKRICVKSNAERQSALENELRAMDIHYENLNDLALVVPSQTERKIVLCAHFDAVAGSYGYNDNGMALVTVLKMLGRLPSNVEAVFTNCEECGLMGAEYYIEHTGAKNIKGCINLDVVGCFDQVYLDPMNFEAARQLTNCKQGTMPMSDAKVFAWGGIPTVCFSSGPSAENFEEGIEEIKATLHNNWNDNRFELLNFEMIGKVTAEVKKAIDLMAAA